MFLSENLLKQEISENNFFFVIIGDRKPLNQICPLQLYIVDPQI